MRKYILVTIPLLLIACSSLTLHKVDSNHLSFTATPNKTMVAEIVQSTIEASVEKLTETATAGETCVQLPCPTCAAVEATSTVVPETPTTAVTETVETPVSEPKAVAATATTNPNTAIDKIYQMQDSSPVYIPNFGHQESGCKWLGVAGQVFDLNGNPRSNVIVIVEGKLNGVDINSVAVTGMTTLYGPGGYEVVLGNTPVTSNGALTITLYGLNGVQQSNSVLFNTLESCQKNLTIINFEQIK
jgi:hypothetical protein